MIGVNEKHATNLRGSVVLLPPLGEPVQDYLAPHGSDPYSSHTASCTGTEGKVSKIISIKKKIPQQIYFLDPMKATLQWNIKEKLERQKAKQKQEF